MNKYIPAIVCGFAAAVLTTIPGLKSFGCCLLVPAAAFISVLLYHKISGVTFVIPTSEALLFGLFTGLTAAIFSSAFDILLTFISHSNDFVEGLPQSESLLKNFSTNPIVMQTFGLMNKMAGEIKASGFSTYYAIIILFSNSITYAIFGMIGGIFGRIILDRRAKK